MSLFDSIISVAAQKFGLGDKAGTLLSGLLSMMTDSNSGGFGGFLSRFSDAGLGDVVNSWISSGANTELSNAQVESALGTGAIGDLASKAGVSSSVATSALGFMIPQVVDKLTPDGTVPEDKDLLSRIGDFLSGWGGAAAGAAASAASAVGSMASGASDRAGAAVGSAANMVGDVAEGGGGLLKWLLPLILLGAALLLGLWFCGKGTTPTAPTNVNANANANKTVNTNSNVNANANTAPVEHKLAEVVLPNGTKLQAYPGGIEDQLVKFIQSDEYKNGTAESLKEKWFSFDDLNFVFGKTELTPESKRQLGNIVSILKAFPDVKLKIGGYTDKKGDDAANLKLSDARAKAVKAALEKEGVGSQVPEAEGYGEKFATVAETASDEERKVDRKTAVRLLKGEAKTTTAAPANANTGAKPAEANTAKPAAANTNAAAKPATATNAAANK